MKRCIVLLMVILVLCQYVPLRSQTMVNLGIEEKVIYVNELGLAPNTILLEAIKMAPEFLSRDENSILENFDVTINDIPVGAAKESILTNTFIYEVQAVEITTDPAVAQSSNGVGGVINIIMDPVNEGLSGNVNVSLSTTFSASPSFNINYRKDKFSLSASGFASYTHTFHKNEEISEEGANTTFNRTAIRNRTLNEAVKLGIFYDFTQNDKLTCWFLQDFQKDRQNDSTIAYMLNGDKAYTDGIFKKSNPIAKNDINIITKYEKRFSRDWQKLQISLSYHTDFQDDSSAVDYKGDYYKDVFSDKYRRCYNGNPHQVNLSAYYRFHLLPASSEHTLKIKIGANLGFEYINDINTSSTYLTKRIMTDHKDTISTQSANYKLAPYFQLYYIWKRLQVTAGARYQFKSNSEHVNSMSWQTDNFHDLLFNAAVIFTPATDHNLKLSTSRTVNTPSNQQLFEGEYYTPYNNVIYCGNPELRQSYIHNLKLEYTYMFKNPLHSLQLNAAVEYINIADIIEKIIDFSPEYHVQYTTWENQGTANIIDANVSLYWSTKVFSMTLSANIYDRLSKSPDKSISHNLCGNIMFSPVLNFERGWMASARFIYNSPILQGSTTIGDRIFMTISASKAWGPWSLRLDFGNIFDYTSTDITLTPEKTVTRTYNPYNSLILVGFTYKF